MSFPPISDLELAAKKHVWAAQKNGNLSNLTPRLIRQLLEKEFSLEEGSLDAPEYRPALKAAAKNALKNEPTQSDDEDTAKIKSPPKNKRKSNGSIKAKSTSPSIIKPVKKAKISAQVVESEDEGTDDAPTPMKKRKIAEDSQPKQTSKATKTNTRKVDTEDEDEESMNSAPPKSMQKKDSKTYKSLEHVPTSDMEQDEPLPVAGSSVSKPAVVQHKKAAASKSKVDESETTPRKPSSAKKTRAKSDESENEDAAADSGSELSVLVDEPPKRKRKSNAGDKAAKKTSGKSKPKKAAKAGAVLSKDEETIKRLKSFVVACGTRKVWSKVFQDLDTPQQQIKKLKEILAELGMTGRLSMERAKAIKEKREMEQELADVTAFAAKIQGTSRNRSAAKSKAEAEEVSDKDNNNASDDEEEVETPSKRPMTARKSIMAFLDDQSDEE